LKIASRLAGIPGAVVTIAAYGVLVLFYAGCHDGGGFNPLPFAGNSWMGIEISEEGEVYCGWRHYKEGDLVRIDGVGISVEKADVVRPRLLGYGTIEWPRVDHRPGTRWQSELDARWGRWRGLFMRDDGRRWFPIPEVGLLELYAFYGAFLGRMGPDGYRDGTVPMRGFEEGSLQIHPVTTDRIWGADTTGAYLLDLEKCSVVRSISAPPGAKRVAIVTPTSESKRKDWVLFAFYVGDEIRLFDETGTALGRVPVPVEFDPDRSIRPVYLCASPRSDRVAFHYSLPTEGPPSPVQFYSRSDGRPLERVMVTPLDRFRGTKEAVAAFLFPAPAIGLPLATRWMEGETRNGRNWSVYFGEIVLSHLLGIALGAFGAWMLDGSVREQCAWAFAGFLLGFGVVALLAFRGPRCTGFMPPIPNAPPAPELFESLTTSL